MTANALAALVFGEVLSAPDPGADPARRLAAPPGVIDWLVGDLRPQLEGWVRAGGPDGEQFCCLADLIAARLAADPALASRGEALTWREGTSVALETLADQLERAGHAGAADECAQALRALHPTPLQPGRLLTVAGPRPRRPAC